MLQEFSEIYFLLIEYFVVVSIQEGNCPFGKRVFVISPANRKPLPIFTKRLEYDYTLSEAVVKLLASTVTFAGIGQARPVGRDTLAARLDDVATKLDVNFGFLENFDKVTSTDFDKVFLQL